MFYYFQLLTLFLVTISANFGQRNLKMDRLKHLCGKYQADSRTAHNIGLAIWRLKCFYETFVQSLTAVILLNFCARNPPHRQAPNR